MSFRDPMAVFIRLLTISLAGWYVVVVGAFSAAKVATPWLDSMPWAEVFLGPLILLGSTALISLALDRLIRLFHDRRG
jgi:hypothetical protein